MRSRRKLTLEQELDIQTRPAPKSLGRNRPENSARAMAEEFDVSIGTIQRIRREGRARKGGR